MRLSGFKKNSRPELTAPERSRLQQWQQSPEPALGLSHYQSRYVVVDAFVPEWGHEPAPVTASDATPPGFMLAALGVQQGLTGAQDSFYMCADSVANWLDFLHFCGKSPLVGYKLTFFMQAVQGRINTTLGIDFEPSGLDLHYLLPEFFSGEGGQGTRLAHWLAHFGLEPGERSEVMRAALNKARLLQRLLVAAQTRGSVSPKALLELDKARRWLRGES